MARSKIILTFLLLVGLFAKAQSLLSLSEAKEIANTYYEAFQQMALHPIGETQFQCEEHILAIFGQDDNGKAIATVFRVPNDLRMLMDNPRKDNETVLITNYIGDFQRIAEKRTLDFSYKTLSTVYPKEPVIAKTDDSPSFVRVVVQKTLNTSGYPSLQINDTMFLNTRDKSVALITNKYRQSGLYDNNVSEEGLLAEAHSKYSDKQFEEAFRLYQKVLEMNPKNDEAWYCLGAMYYWEEGTGKLGWKQRQSKAYEHFKKADEYVDKTDSKKVAKIHKAINVVTHGRE